jgi:RNA polymerase sigma factor (sigma-70 family)
MERMAETARSVSVDDLELIGKIGHRDQWAFETLMRRYNGRLFRVARAILKDDAEAEDALQDAYIEVLRHSGDFRGASELSTWLTRITINQALMRLRRQRRDRIVVPFGERQRESPEPTPAASGERDMADHRIESPPNAAWRAEVRALLERRIDELPVAFRTVFVMREVEDMTVDETAACLGIPPATVRTRHFRARALLRESLAREIDTATTDVFAFAGARCDRVVRNVLARLGTADASRSSN